MAQLGNFLNAPRSHSHHMRYRRFARIGNGADQLSAFLSTQATRLSSTSSAIFTKLKKYTADKIRSATTLSDIP